MMIEIAVVAITTYLLFGLKFAVLAAIGLSAVRLSPHVLQLFRRESDRQR